MMKAIHLVLMPILLAANTVQAGLEEDLETFREENGLTAIVAGVWEGDNSVFRGAFGSAMPGIPADLTMKFRGGGVCLTALTAILLQTAEEGLVDLDDTIDEWLPELPMADQVTLRMLANCTSGYGDYVPNEDFLDSFDENPFQFFTPQQLIDYGLEGGMRYKPGEDWGYTHTTFVMIGLILEQVHGQDIPDLMEERVFEALALSDTVYTVGPDLKPPLLHSYTTERGVFEDSTFWNPSWTSFSGSIGSVVDDVALIIRSIGSASLISPSSLKEMIAPTTVGLGPNTENRFYGMGIGVVNGILLQNPNFGRYQGIVAYDPKEDKTMIAFVTLGQEADPSAHHGMMLYPILKSFAEGL